MTRWLTLTSAAVLLALILGDGRRAYGGVMVAGASADVPVDQSSELSSLVDSLQPAEPAMLVGVGGGGQMSPVSTSGASATGAVPLAVLALAHEFSDQSSILRAVNDRRFFLPIAPATRLFRPPRA